MNQAATSSQPSLIVVTGRPASGKTTLARLLAPAIRCPMICRDEIKEGFVNTTGDGGTPGDHVAQGVYETFFDTVTLLLRRRITLVAVAAFQHKNWESKLTSLREIAHTRIIVCVVDPVLARARHIQRGFADPGRELFHHDAEVRAAREGRELPIEAYDPPRLDVPTLTVDTSGVYQPSFEQIVAFASDCT